MKRYYIEARDLYGERVRFNSPRRADVDKMEKAWQAKGYTDIHRHFG